jgi:hypothetical protein
LPEKIQFHSPNSIPAGLHDELADLAAQNWAPAVHDAMAEYVPLMASALSRAAVVAPSDFLADLRLANSKVGQILRGRQATASQKVAMLTDLNAALSRCTSQVFSGSSPIGETECHFWAHSLLGTGVANIALARIRSFVESTIGKARIPERLASYVHIVDNVPDLRAELDAASWDQNFIDTNSALPKRKRDLFPLITYLSGRAGFNTTETTLSAPLTALTSCTSLKWSLFTLTHELSHGVVHAVLARLLPDASKSAELEASATLLRARKPARSLFDEARRFILQTMAEMQAVAEGKEFVDVDADNIPVLIRNWLEEVEELMVHAFDYLYFYAEKSKYVPAIWHSWGVLPYIHDKVPEYVMRSLCTISLDHAGMDRQIMDAARQQLAGEFARLSKRYAKGSHVHRALNYLEHQWNAEIRVPLIVRLPIARFVRALMYSPKLAKAFQGETKVIGSSKSRRRDYPHVPLEFSADEVQNPLHFIEKYTHLLGSQAASAWMLNTLAFNTRSDGHS